MEFKAVKEAVCANEVVCDCVVEQPIECDFILPDYCPDILRILKCQVEPRVTTRQVSGDKLNIEGFTCVKVFYVSDTGCDIKSFDYKVPFSKMCELREAVDNPVVRVCTRLDYANCRALNQRRMDVRGAFTMNVKVTGQRPNEVISDAEGGGMQLKKKMVAVSSVVGSACRQFTVREDLEIGYGKPAVQTILRSEATAVITDYKMISNKIIAKGEATLHTLYVSNEDKPEIMEHSIPISQILDVDGVDEDCECGVRLEVVSLEVEAKADAEGESKLLGVEICISADAVAYRGSEMAVVTDAYSTSYEIRTASKPVSIPRLEQMIQTSCMTKNAVQLDGEGMGCIIDLWCRPAVTQVQCGEGCLEITGTLQVCILGADPQGEACYTEKTLEFSHQADYKKCRENLTFDYAVTPASVGYSLSGNSEVEVRCELKIDISVFSTMGDHLISELEIDEEAPKKTDNRASLTIYYADRGERIWDIAKKYNTSVIAVLEENGLENDEVEDRGMLLIPMVR